MPAKRIQPNQIEVMADLGLLHCEHQSGHHSFRARGLVIDYWPRKQKWQINKGPVKIGFEALRVYAEREVKRLRAEDMPVPCGICGNPAPNGYAFHRRCMIEYASKGCGIGPDAFLQIGAHE